MNYLTYMEKSTEKIKSFHFSLQYAGYLHLIKNVSPSLRQQRGGYLSKAFSFTLLLIFDKTIMEIFLFGTSSFLEKC